MATKSKNTQSRKNRKQRVRLKAASNTSKERRSSPTFVKADETKIGFSDLPAELRNLIYESALCLGIDCTIPLTVGSILGINKDLAFNILATCKAVYREASHVLYGGNAFRIDLLRTDVDTHPWRSQDASRYNPSPDGAMQRARQLAWKRWEERAMPKLASSLELIAPKRLAEVKMFVFTYHSERLEPDQKPDMYDFSREPEIALALGFFPDAPCFRFGLSTAWTLSEDFESTLTSYIVGTISTRNLRALSRRDVLEFAEWVVHKCDDVRQDFPMLETQADLYFHLS